MKKGRTSCLAGILLLTNVASAASQQTGWDKPGIHGENSTFHRDNYECLKENPPGPYLAHRYSSPENDRADQASKAAAVKAAENLYKECMRARGYVLRRLSDGKIIP